MGRWYVQDPQQQFVSPYLAMGNNPISLVDPDGEFVPLLIGVGIGLVSGYMSGRASGATGGELAFQTLAGGLIGGFSGGIGSSVAAGVGASVSGAFGGLLGAAAGGTAAGASSGVFMSGLTGGDPLEGLWKGGVSGLVGGSVGSYVSGGLGALTGGFAGGGTSAALYGGDAGDILTSGLIGGAIGYGSYQAQMEIGYRSSDMKVNGEPLTRKQYRGMSLAAQRSFARGKEWGGWLLEGGGIELDPGLGTRFETNRGPMPENAVARFHTHPNIGVGRVDGVPTYFPEPHSPRDIGITRYLLKVNSYVIGRQNTYRYSQFLADPVMTDYNSWLRYPFYIHNLFR